MTAATLEPRQVLPADRLGLTLLVAIIVHTMVVLGVGYGMPKPDTTPDMLEVTLVNARSDEAPDKADALAQANLQGGGDSRERVRPTTTDRAAVPADTPAASSPLPTQGQPRPNVDPTTDHVMEAPPQPAPQSAKVHQQPQKATPKLVAEREKKPELPRARPTASPVESIPVPQDDPAPASPEGSDAPQLPTAAQLITRSFQMASMDAELEDRMSRLAKRTRQKYISASTREYRYAAYMEAWRAKVERIGNLNYPDEARQQQLSGELLLDVSLRPDGSVIEVLVRRSSGHRALDDAAVRIVKLASPFAAFPADIAREVDVLHVTRTWRFLNSAEFKAQ